MKLKKSCNSFLFPVLILLFLFSFNNAFSGETKEGTESEDLSTFNLTVDDYLFDLISACATLEEESTDEEKVYCEEVLSTAEKAITARDTNDIYNTRRVVSLTNRELLLTCYLDDDDVIGGGFCKTQRNEVKEILLKKENLHLFSSILLECVANSGLIIDISNTDLCKTLTNLMKSEDGQSYIIRRPHRRPWHLPPIIVRPPLHRFPRVPRYAWWLTLYPLLPFDPYVVNCTLYPYDCRYWCGRYPLACYDYCAKPWNREWCWNHNLP